MADFGFKIVPKKLFFDSEKILKEVNAADRKVLSKVGAFIRTRARSLVGKRGRKGQRAADPGKPPLKRNGLLQNQIFFAYDPDTKAVDIGPTLIGKGAAGILEHGGEENIKVPDHGKMREVRAKYRGNPFMMPSLQAELEKGTIPPQWANSVRS